MVAITSRGDLGKVARTTSFHLENAYSIFVSDD